MTSGNDVGGSTGVGQSTANSVSHPSFANPLQSPNPSSQLAIAQSVPSHVSTVPGKSVHGSHDPHPNAGSSLATHSPAHLASPTAQAASTVASPALPPAPPPPLPPPPPFR